MKRENSPTMHSNFKVLFTAISRYKDRGKVQFLRAHARRTGPVNICCAIKWDSLSKHIRMLSVFFSKVKRRSQRSTVVHGSVFSSHYNFRSFHSFLLFSLFFLVFLLLVFFFFFYFSKYWPWANELGRLFISSYPWQHAIELLFLRFD